MRIPVVRHWLAFALAASLVAMAGCGDDGSDLPIPDLGAARDQAVVLGADLVVAPDLFGLDGPGAPPADLVSGPLDFAGVDFTLPPQPDLSGLAPCMNGVKDGSETDLDCGGGVCGACDVGRACQKGADCRTGLCLNLRCDNPPMSKVAFAAAVTYPAGSLPVKVAAGDLNGDGKLDLVTANQGTFGKTSDVSVLLGKGDGTFNAQVRTGVGYNPSWAVTVDLNGDKRDDVAVANAGANNNPGALGALIASAQGTLGNPLNVNLTGGPSALVGGDFDKDGKADVVVVANGLGKAGSGFVLLGKGDGNFQVPVAFGVGSSPSDVQAGDFNGDGTLDLAVANGGDFSGPALVALHLGGPGGSFAPGKTVQSGPGTTAVAIADLDRDGKLDLCSLVTVNMAANVTLLRGKGDGTFQAPVNKALRGGDPSALAIADLDGDGRLDVAVAYRSGTVGVLPGNGDGTVGGEVGFPAVSNMGGYSLVVGDWNADKKPDLAVTDYFKNLVAVLLNQTP